MWKTVPKSLLKEWQRRLEESGFEDAEMDLKSIRVLKRKSNEVFRDTDVLYRENYYNHLSRLIATEPEFDCKEDKLIMSLYSEGKRIVDISKIMKKKGMKSYRATIRKVIKIYNTRWGLKK